MQTIAQLINQLGNQIEKLKSQSEGALTTNHLLGLAEYYKISPAPRSDIVNLSASFEGFGMVDLLNAYKRTQSAISSLTVDEVLELCDASM